MYCGERVFELIKSFGIVEDEEEEDVLVVVPWVIVQFNWYPNFSPFHSLGSCQKRSIIALLPSTVLCCVA